MRVPFSLKALLFLLLVGILSSGAVAHAGEADGESSGRALSLGSRWEMTLVPGNHLYPVYIADPRRATFALQRLSFSSTDIPDSGTSRYGIKFGGRFGLLRIHPQGEPHRGVQLDVEAGFIGQFDSEYSLDNVGWDGIYSLSVSWRPRGRSAVRCGMHHTSSHKGDEYLERTGRRRIDYTRQELLLGASRTFGERWQVYGEAGSAYDMRNEKLQEPGRLQAGLQYETGGLIWKRRLGLYAALDCSAFEEREWALNLAAQAGLVLNARGPAWRIGVEHYRGRSWMGEFFQADERYTALVISIDL